LPPHQRSIRTRVFPSPRAQFPDERRLAGHGRSRKRHQNSQRSQADHCRPSRLWSLRRARCSTIRRQVRLSLPLPFRNPLAHLGEAREMSARRRTSVDRIA
jgi:hypothetical protein